MKRNKTLFFAVPLMLILVFLVVYQYGYLGIKAETASVKEEQDVKLKLLQKYMTLIAEKPRDRKADHLIKGRKKV